MKCMLSLIVLQNLRDEHGNLYPQNLYNLQQSADGRIHLLPRDSTGTNGAVAGSSNAASQQQQHPHNHHHQPHQPHHNGHNQHHRNH